MTKEQPDRTVNCSACGVSGEPGREDYRELIESFAVVLYQIFEPGNEDAILDISKAARLKAAANYFNSQPRACYALKTLVAIAMRNRERWGWTLVRRKAEDDRIEMQTLTALYEAAHFPGRAAAFPRS